MRSFVVLFAVLIAVVLIAAKVQAAPEGGDGGDCYYEDLKTSVKRGEFTDVKGECLRVRCTDTGDLRLEPCELAIPPNCKIVTGDLSKAYPSCCPTLECA